jgi:hypothetical protein
VVDVCRRVAVRLPDLSEHITDCVFAELPEYSRAGVPRQDVVAGVRRNNEAMLASIAEKREPDASELAAHSELGRRRARQGIAASDLVRAFLVGYRETWNAVMEEAAGDAAVSPLLLEAATTAWSWTHLVSSAVAEAHKDVDRAQAVEEIERLRQLFEWIRAGDLASEDAVRVTRSLGFDPAGSFQAVCARATPSVGEAALALTRALKFVPGTHVALAQGDRLLVLSQGGKRAALVQAMRRTLGDAATLGVSLQRSGLAGARLAIDDAERTVAAAGEGSTASFEDEWFTALISSAYESIAPLVAAGLGAATRHPHILTAVDGYFATGMSQLETARRLHVHPHTIAYRLGRWKSLTGWDVSTTGGLLLTLAALRLRDATAHAAR